MFRDTGFSGSTHFLSVRSVVTVINCYLAVSRRLCYLNVAPLVLHQKTLAMLPYVFFFLCPEFV